MFEFLINKLKAHPRKIVFTEGSDPRILEASARLLSGTFLTPVLVGNEAEIQAAAEKAGLSKKDTEAVITATLASITEALQNDDKVQLVGFGSFEVKKRAARTGLNPRTKETIEIPASAVPTFKAGKALKDAVAK
mgnify:CR=1 FL=1